MAWEHRRSRRYFYRCVRREGRPCKLYVGSGPMADFMARQVAEARLARQAERDARLAEQAHLSRADQALAALTEWIHLLTAATLFGYGYHLHRGEWRRWRTRQ